MPGPTSYLLEVQDATAHTAVNRYTISSGSTTSYTLSGLIAGDSYKWKVYAFADSTISPPSAVYYFKIQLPPAAPILVGPGSGQSGASGNGTTQIFQWKQVPSATKYLLEVQDVTAHLRYSTARFPAARRPATSLAGSRPGTGTNGRCMPTPARPLARVAGRLLQAERKLSPNLGDHNIFGVPPGDAGDSPVRFQDAHAMQANPHPRAPRAPCETSSWSSPGGRGEFHSYRDSASARPPEAVGIGRLAAEVAAGLSDVGSSKGGDCFEWVRATAPVGAIELQIGDDDFSHRPQVQGLIDLLQQLAFQFL